MTDETPAPTRRRRRAAQPVGPGTEPPAPAATGAQTSPAGDAPATAGETTTSVLRVERGGIAEATAGSVEVHLGGIGRLDAEETFVQWGGVGLARSDRLGVELGSVGAALTGEARITQGYAGTLVARDIVVEQALVRTMVAQRVTANRPTGVLVLIAQQVSGDVRPVLDWRGGLVAGIAFGIVVAVGRRLFARR